VTASEQPVFLREGEAFAPTAHARGPWDPNAQHGGAPAALIARAVERAAPGDGMAVARLTYEFLGPVPLAPLTVAAEVVKPGSRFQLVEAELAVDGRPVVRARAVRLRRHAIEPPGGRDADAPPGGPPEHATAVPFPLVTGPEEGFHLTAMEIRFGGGTSFAPGAALAWFRLARPLVDGEEPTALQRVAAAADFGNGVSRLLDWERWLFVNTDLSIHLHREPAGEWVLLDAQTRIDALGIGVASSTLHDERGPLGVAAQTLFVEAR
jgi:Thioesterase-like superfamily